MSIVLNPFQLQMAAAMLSGAPLVAVRAGWGSGKTFGIVQTILILNEYYLTRVGRPMRTLLITDTDHRYSTTLHPEMVGVLMPLGWSFVPTGGKRWVGPNGEVVWVRAYFRASTKTVDQNPIEGYNVDNCIIDEAQTMQPEVYTRALGRIRTGAPPQILLSGLPTWDDWWVKQAQDVDGGKVILANSYVNRDVLSEAWFEQMKQSGEFEEKVLNCPKAPQGAVYSEWTPLHHPLGNFAPEGWTYNPEMVAYLMVDFGYRHPSALIFVEDKTLGADIIIADINPENCTTEAFANIILEVAAPRSQGREGVIQLDFGTGDVAGNQRQSAGGSTDMEEFQAAMGMPVTSPPHEHRRIAEGVGQVRTRILNASGERRLLCLKQIWDDGLSNKGVSFSRAMASYKYPTRGSKDEPVKDGQEHPLDALRYGIGTWRWWVRHDAAEIRRAMNTPMNAKPSFHAAYYGSR